jgi:hypothetical protein
MSTRISIAVLRAAARVVVVAAMLALAGAQFGSPPARAAATDKSCGWFLEPTADRENILFPEITTRYLAAITPPPPGGYVEITGQFPHARYMSLQTYSNTLQSISDLRDTQIAPDKGSSNPYLPGANRTVSKRSYTIRLVDGRAPASGGPANTLYDMSSDGTKVGYGLAYRIYEPDSGTEPFGGVPAPTLTFVLADGTRVPVPQCPDVVPDTTPLTELLAASGYSDYPQIPTGGQLATQPVVWHKYVNAPSGYANSLTAGQLLGSYAGKPLQQVALQLPAGLGENADNKYVYGFFSVEFGQVAVLRGKLPTTPHTFDGEPVMGTGQLRFWSMCTGGTGSQAYACLVDKDVPTDRNGYFTIAISTPADRPSDATARCGVAWLPYGPQPQTTVIMRNMLPAPDFPEAIQNAQPGTEQKTLGAYYPASSYYAAAGAFDSGVGCHRPAVPVPPPTVAPARCSKRSVLHFTIHSRSGRVTLVRVYVAGRLARTVRGHNVRRLAVKRPSRRSFTIKLVAVTVRHRRLTIRRHYRSCIAKTARR